MVLLGGFHVESTLPAERYVRLPLDFLRPVNHIDMRANQAEGDGLPLYHSVCSLWTVSSLPLCSVYGTLEGEPHVLILPHNRQRIWSATTLQNLKGFGKSSFSFTAPTVWNSLPINFRNPPSEIKSQLKTCLFRLAFP